MKKKYKFNELSPHICSTPGCTRRLKKRLVASKPTVDICYRCWKTAEHMRRNHQILMW